MNEKMPRRECPHTVVWNQDTTMHTCRGCGMRFYVSDAAPSTPAAPPIAAKPSAEAAVAYLKDCCIATGEAEFAQAAAMIEQQAVALAEKDADCAQMARDAIDAEAALARSRRRVSNMRRALRQLNAAHGVLWRLIGLYMNRAADNLRADESKGSGG